MAALLRPVRRWRRRFGLWGGEEHGDGGVQRKQRRRFLCARSHLSRGICPSLILKFIKWLASDRSSYCHK
jgi:hypothetical protein